MTQYSHFPIVDPRTPPTVPLKQMPIYNIQQTFNPGNTQSPFSGYATNVDHESELRNQIYALQKCSQAVYVPSSKSDLYETKFFTSTQPMPHSLLFKEEPFPSFNPNPNVATCGSGIFYNNTRCQIKDFTKQKH